MNQEKLCLILQNYLLRYDNLYKAGLTLMILGVFSRWWCTGGFISYCFSGINIQFSLRLLIDRPEQWQSYLVEENRGVLILFLTMLLILLKFYCRKPVFWSNISIHFIGFGIIFIILSKLEYIQRNNLVVGSSLGIGLYLILIGSILVSIYGAVNFWPPQNLP